MFIGLLIGHPPVFGSNFALRREVWQRIRNTVVRDNANVHDDFDISYRLRPGMTVIYERKLLVGVSARPFANWSSMRRRLELSLATFLVEFADEPPLRRRMDRLRWQRAQGKAADGG